jgi:hypothetical protein
MMFILEANNHSTQTLVTKQHVNIKIQVVNIVPVIYKGR